MNNKKIQLITCDSGDWEVVKILNDDVDIFTEGHSISKNDWIALLGYIGVEVEEINISDEDMEMGSY